MCPTHSHRQLGRNTAPAFRRTENSVIGEKMKKAKPKTHVPEDSGSGRKDVDKYVADAAKPARSMLKEMRELIRSALPAEATETISYRIPAFRHNGIVVWYAAFAHHCSLFPTAAVIEMFKKELRDYSTSKGTIQFPTDKPLHKALIKRIVKARVATIQRKKQR